MGFGGLSMPEMIVVALIALLLFGKKVPEVARSLGKGIVEFKKCLRETGDESSVPMFEPSKSQSP